mmetsp:Transcript_25782/g.64992  ORF Transcript_25782/g.64992 Transcript_25782/m.64992 type:complete len:267 (-) Transcript_25782:3467-4267(-)
MFHSTLNKACVGLSAGDRVGFAHVVDHKLDAVKAQKARLHGEEVREEKLEEPKVVPRHAGNRQYGDLAPADAGGGAAGRFFPQEQVDVLLLGHQGEILLEVRRLREVLPKQGGLLDETVALYRRPRIGRLGMSAGGGCWGRCGPRGSLRRRDGRNFTADNAVAVSVLPVSPEINEVPLLGAEAQRAGTPRASVLKPFRGFLVGVPATQDFLGPDLFSGAFLLQPRIPLTHHLRRLARDTVAPPALLVLALASVVLVRLRLLVGCFY